MNRPTAPAALFAFSLAFTSHAIWNTPTALTTAAAAAWVWTIRKELASW